MESSVEIVTTIDPNLTSGGNIYNAKLTEACRSRGIDMQVYWTSKPESYIKKHIDQKLLIIDSVVINESINWRQFQDLSFLIHMWPSDETAAGKETENWIAENFRMIYAGAKAIKPVQHKEDRLLLPPGIESDWRKRQLNNTLPKKFVSIGSINGQKGHVETLDALIGLSSTKWRWEIFGEIQNRDTFKVLEAKIYEHQLENQVYFMGEIAHKEVNDVMLNADLLIHFSKHENNAMVLREAIATRLPFVSSPTGDFEALKSLNCGLFTNSMQTADLTTVLAYLMAPNGKYSLLQKGVSQVEIQSWDAAAELFINYLNS